MRTLKTGDPCPCCGQPIEYTDPDKLRMLAMIADLLQLPEREVFGSRKISGFGQATDEKEKE
ncbi:hypothetical protein OBV_19870 [Oscillibacter valericigenes Sjm18-20]|nr:hypothetical protein OBV_19870 [Oscillibacter valericigenes Sjm18-20]